MNVCLVSVVTVWHGVNGGIEIHGKLLTEGLVGLGHSVTVVASRHPAGVGAEARSGVRIRYARAGQFGSQGGAWAGEGTRLVSARHLEAPIEAGLALLLLFNLLDCVDGSIARAMGTGNPYGRFLDSACGAVVDLGFWAAVGIAAFRHPSLLAKPEGFGHGPFLWLVAARSPCLLAAYVGQLERSFDELVRSEWVRLQTAAPARPAAPGPQPAEAALARRLRPAVREVVTSLRVRETQYVLLAVAAVLGAVDLLVVGYLGFYLVLDVSLLAVYASRGRQVRGGRRAPAGSA